MDLSRTVSEMTAISFENRKIPPPLHFALLLKAFSLELGTSAGFRKVEWWSYLRDKEVWRYLQPPGCNASSRELPLWALRRGVATPTAPEIGRVSCRYKRVEDSTASHRCI